MNLLMKFDFMKHIFADLHINPNYFIEERQPIILLAHILKDNNIKIFEDAEKCNELWDINNGITLCVGCHKLTNNYLNNNL